MGPGPSPSPSPTPNAARTLTSHSLGAMASSAAAVSIAVTRAALGCGARTRSEVAREENATLPTSNSPSMVAAARAAQFRTLSLKGGSEQPEIIALTRQPRKST